VKRAVLAILIIAGLSLGPRVANLNAFSSAAKPNAERARYNVLFIAVDDLNNSLGCYGHLVVKSPNIDRLAARGVRFDRAYCQYPLCNPSRTSLLTGLRPDTTNIFGNQTHFRTKLPDVVTLPELFRQNGYFAASLGKIYHRIGDMDDAKSWDAAQYPVGTARGRQGEGRNLTGGRLRWCEWRAAEGDDEDQPDGQIAREAIRILEEKRDKPFFLAVGFHKPHDPFVAPKKYFNLYPLESLRLPKEPTDRSPEAPLALPRGFKEEFDKFTDKERLEFMRAYYACTSFMDAQVGKLLDALERLKLADNTIVVFFGDHGYHVGERGWWNKSTLFELSCRAPLIVAAPGMKASGKSCARLVEFVDIYPTLTDCAGIKPATTLHGRSFRPLLDNPTQPWKQTAFTQVQRGAGMAYSVRTERWRYTEWPDGNAELYDHDNDPDEWHNLARDAQHAKTAAELKLLITRSK